MSKTAINSFCKQFVAVLKGDNTEVQAEKAWRACESGLKVSIAAMEGDSIKLEDDVASAIERLDQARVNKGEIPSNRDIYVSNLIDAKNSLNKAEKVLKAHNETLSFLKNEYETLKS